MTVEIQFSTIRWPTFGQNSMLENAKKKIAGTENDADEGAGLDDIVPDGGEEEAPEEDIEAEDWFWNPWVNIYIHVSKVSEAYGSFPYRGFSIVT